MAADAGGDSAIVRAWLLVEARRLQKRQEAIRRRLVVIRAIMRIVCRRGHPPLRRIEP